MNNGYAVGEIPNSNNNNNNGIVMGQKVKHICSSYAYFMRSWSM